MSKHATLYLFILLLLGHNTFAQNKDLIEKSMIPFWKTKTMYNESVLMISENGAAPKAQLLFKPTRITSVKNAALTEQYQEGKDWIYRDNKLILLPNSTARFMTKSELFPDSSGRFPRKGGGTVFHSEGTFFHDRQLVVTYKHKRKLWKGPVSEPDNLVLAKTSKKLERKEKLHILLYGDSISAGANASGRSNTAPNLPDWGSLFVQNFRNHFGAEIKFTNTSVGGMDSKWGLKNVDSMVNLYTPDLVIIAFGMNDGTGKMSPEVFGNNIKGMIEKVRVHNPNTEFILVETMLPNPESLFTGTQLAFKATLDTIAKEHNAAVVDMTSVHQELLKHKSYQDMTGNNINHPNDFLIRWYAQMASGLFIK